MVCYIWMCLLLSYGGVIAASAMANPAFPPLIPQEQSTLSMSVNGNVVKIQNATPGSKLEVYNVLGIKVLSLKLDAADKSFALNLSKGCYILKLENLVRKIAIR